MKITISSATEDDFLEGEIESEDGAILVISRDAIGELYVQWAHSDQTYKFAKKVALTELISAIESIRDRIC